MRRLTGVLALWALVWLSCLIGSTPAKANEEFVSALTGKFPPFSFYDEKGELTGFDVDISREIAHRLNRSCRIVTTEWDGILAGLLAEKYDVIVGSMAITPERRRQVNFSRPYYESGAQLFVHRSNPEQVYSIRDCKGLKVAVVLGETYQRYLEKNYPGIEVVTFKSTVEIFEMLDQHRIAGFVTDRLVGSWQIRQAHRSFVPVGPMLYSERIGIPVRKPDRELLRRINTVLTEMEADGTRKKLFEQYFGLHGTSVTHSGEMTLSTKVFKLLKGFGVTLLIAFLAVLIGFLLAIPAGLLLTFRKGVWRFPGWVMRWCVDFIRGTPVLIQLLFVWLGLGLSPFPAAILTLGICTMAYMAESVRSGLIAVDPGQGLAARALGLSPIDRFRFIIWPQAFRIAMPSLMNSVVALIKDTALVSIISIPELIREAQSIISVTFEPRKYYLIVALMFFAVTFPLMKLAGKIEKRIQGKGFENA